MNVAFRWGDVNLDAARQVGDPAADEAVSRLDVLGGRDCGRILREWRENSQPVPSGLPPVVRSFLGASAALPSWADETSIDRAQRLYDRYAADLLAMLLYAALPQCYAAANGAEVLLQTKRMAAAPRSRLTDTARFVVDVMSKRAMTPRGRGIRSAQKIRLIHAFLRRGLMAGGNWDGSKGVPINQEDMAGTLVAFSQVSLAALIKMGARVERPDQDAYVHAWSVVGHLLGLRRDLLADSFEEARCLSDAIRRRHHRKSEAGQELTLPLLAFAESRFPGPLKGLPAALMRYLITDETADLLGIPSANRTRHLVTLLRAGFWSRDFVSQLVPPVRVVDFYNRLPFVKAVLWVESRNGDAPALAAGERHITRIASGGGSSE